MRTLDFDWVTVYAGLRYGSGESEMIHNWGSITVPQMALAYFANCFFMGNYPKFKNNLM